MTKNLVSALGHAGLKSTKVDLSRDKEFMERCKKYSEVLKKFISDKEKFEERCNTTTQFYCVYGYSNS